MSELVIRSNHEGDQLKVWTIKPGDQWRARIDFGDLIAEAKVYERFSRDALRLDVYLADLADNWRGGTATRTGRRLVFDWLHVTTASVM